MSSADLLGAVQSFRACGVPHSTQPCNHALPGRARFVRFLTKVWFVYLCVATPSYQAHPADARFVPRLPSPPGVLLSSITVVPNPLILWAMVAVARQLLAHLQSSLNAQCLSSPGRSRSTVLGGERERDGSGEQFTPSVFGEQELCFSARVSHRAPLTSACTPACWVVEISRDEFKPLCRTMQLNIAMRGAAS